jgi:hypothetical protein
MEPYGAGLNPSQNMAQKPAGRVYGLRNLGLSRPLDRVHVLRVRTVLLALLVLALAPSCRHRPRAAKPLRTTGDLTVVIYNAHLESLLTATATVHVVDQPARTYLLVRDERVPTRHAWEASFEFPLSSRIVLEFDLLTLGERSGFTHELILGGNQTERFTYDFDTATGALSLTKQ